MNKCEWKKELVDGSPEKYVKTGLVFYPCNEFNPRTYKEYRKRIINHIKCASCGADIRKPEPAEPLIVKSGETWVAHWKEIDYLWTGGSFLKTIKPPFSMTTPKYGQWKSFTGPDLDIIELTDEIAKLRPMVIVSNKPEVLEMKEMLVYVHHGKGIDNAYKYTTTGTTWANCRLATAHELQESQK